MQSIKQRPPLGILRLLRQGLRQDFAKDCVQQIMTALHLSRRHMQVSGEPETAMTGFQQQWHGQSVGSYLCHATMALHSIVHLCHRDGLLQ